MRAVRYLIVGGGLAAHRAAQQLARRDPGGAALLVSDERDPPYDRPPLSKEFLRGERRADTLAYPLVEGVDMALGVRCIHLDPTAHRATLSDGRTVEFERALIATGGRPRLLDVPGADAGGVHSLRTLPDAAAIDAAAAGARSAAIVGAGFIGMEAAASLVARGLEVTVVEAAPRVWAGFVPEALSTFFARYCTDRGVRFETGARVTRIDADRNARVVLADRDAVGADLVIVAVGIEPNVELAVAAGLEVADGIVVNEHLQTSAADVYAAGDVASSPDPVFGRRRRVEHWGAAEYGGQVAAWNMSGDSKPYDLLSYAWSDIFDLHLEFAGDEAPGDRVVTRGTIDDGRFTMLYLAGEYLSAYFAVNGNRRDFGPLQKLIRGRVPLGGREDRLADPDFSLRGLL